MIMTSNDAMTNTNVIDIIQWSNDDMKYYYYWYYWYD